MTNQHPITPPPPHLLKKFSAQAQDETKKRNGAGYLKTFAALCIEWAMNSQSTPNDRQIKSSEIQPPPELVEQWKQQFLERPTINGCFIQSYIATKAVRWGADQELEACCQWLDWQKLAKHENMIAYLRAARRPKPPSDKEQALNALSLIMSRQKGMFDGKPFETIRKALEALDD